MVHRGWSAAAKSPNAIKSNFNGCLPLPCIFLFACSLPSDIDVGDVVAVDEHRRGRVRYIGHLDGDGHDADEVFAGIELHTPGRPYFIVPFNASDMALKSLVN